MSTLSNFRRENLRRLIAQHGGPNELGAKLGYSNGSFLVQMAGPAPIRDVSERTARKFEQALNLPVGILDHEVEVTGAVELPKRRAYKHGNVPPLTTETQAKNLNNDELGKLIKSIGELSAEGGVNLPPLKFSDILMLSIADAIANQGQPNTEKIKTLVSLVK
jgi:hypothetical protein